MPQQARLTASFPIICQLDKVPASTLDPNRSVEAEVRAAPVVERATVHICQIAIVRGH